MSEWEEELALERRLKLEAYEKCIEMINGILPKEEEKLSDDELRALVEEIEYYVRSLKNEY